MAMTLYTCGQKKANGRTGHPCGRAALALDKAGHSYEIEALPGYRLLPWTWAERKAGRQKVVELSGTPEVPVLVLDDGTVISDSSRIVKWAKENPAT